MQGKTEVVNPRLRDVVVALGSNQGDREIHLEYAISSLEKHLTDMRVSPLIETAAEAVGQQPDFLNGVVVGLVELSPENVMNVLLGIERERGRIRPYAGAPRTLDLDLILMGSCVCDNDCVQLPHPRFRQRRLVLEPLVAIAPTLVDPITGSTMAELLSALTSEAR